MKTIDTQTVYKQMLNAIDELYGRAKTFQWQDEATYANWLAQSFNYVSWTTRQLALASAMTKPGTEDSYHWRFIDEAREEKKHELLCLHDIKQLGYDVSMFPEFPHTAFFYQSLNYMIEREHPISLIGFSLTLEGFAATKLNEFYPIVKQAHGEKASTFLKLHCELDVDHFQNALPYLQACPTELLPGVSKSISLCTAIYKGILDDITQYQTKYPTAQRTGSVEKAI
ncbi:MAG: iron-containing redox enzyme family protein [Bdellovibrionaceae bacterium]|nr:iron-containing redox enzyme family protein [Pseudobdellovibrionaceae bacterium]